MTNKPELSCPQAYIDLGKTFGEQFLGEIKDVIFNGLVKSLFKPWYFIHNFLFD
jgi:hypothetical protein